MQLGLMFIPPTIADPMAKWQSCLLRVRTIPWEVVGGSGGGSLGRLEAADAGADAAEAESPMSMSFTNQYMGTAGSAAAALTAADLSAALAAVKRPGEVRLKSERRSDQAEPAAARPPPPPLGRPEKTESGGRPPGLGVRR